jgi:DNA-binding XRE family transcriptional regulator/predicted RNase H-like HicB family nuclease
MRFAAYVVKEKSTEAAIFPDCPGCATQAGRGEDLTANLAEALTSWIEAELQAGRVPPRPRSSPRAPKGGRVQWVPVPALLATRLGLIWARTDAGLSQAELARRAGVSQQAIAKLEHPDSNPTVETLQKVADALHSELVIHLQTRGEP